ncbi:protein rds1 [Xylona heveae TC161]|uniref:Protein rds1 n=1 Tax=Xylona heveae (strain CBS 132557 / TC161) TaxID=1328760 RepID=A0A165FNP6_XYLHT|nr:protein rds1 [Xylona heveae TC161]KZF21196.1 protein rds1 [Xylona heveae TC161]
MANASVPVQYTSAVSPPPVVSSQLTEASHGSFTGRATTTGALSLSVQAQSIPALPPSPAETNGYPSDGQLHEPEPAPFTPAGGEGTNGSEPVYRVQSDFDFESIALGLYQEYIELDVFHNGLAMFSAADFQAAGLTAEDRFLIEFMADQEVGHATLLTNILGPQAAPKQCTYNYPFQTVREFVDFNQKLTRVGESGVYGFLNHLDSRPVGQLLLQSISTEARQQMIFRQFDGLFPMPVWFEVGIPQSWAWTLIAPYISSCPQNQTRLAWQNYPALHVINQPNAARTNANQTGSNETQGFSIEAPLNDAIVPSSSLCVNATGVGSNCNPAITHNRSIPLSYPGRLVQLQWDAPGQLVGPNNSYVTSTSAGAPSWVAWVNQLNVTYSKLTLTGNNTGTTIQPNVSTFENNPMINGTVFIALVDTPLALSPFNLSQINPHVAALTLYQAG